MIRKSGWQSVVEALKIEGIKYLFGLPSSPLDLYDALFDETSIKAIQTRHEGAGCAMAMGYSLASGQPSVCYAGAGPGVANLAPTMLEALATCAPVIALSSAPNQKDSGKGAFQETDQIGLMKPLTKWAVSVSYPEKIPWALQRAFSLATNGQPGPIFIEIPYDVGRPKAEIPLYVAAERKIRPAGDPDRINMAVSLLAKAKLPILISGGGARVSGAHQQIKALAELLGMPVLTTPSGRGIISEDHPLSIGQVGLYRTRLGIRAFEDADLLISIGSRNEEFQTGAWKIFPPKATFIQVDIESFEIGRNWKPELAIIGDAKLVLEAILEQLSHERSQVWIKRAKELTNEKQAYEAEIRKECLEDQTQLTSKRIVFELNQVFGKDTILVNENGSQDLWSYYAPYYKVLDLDGCIAPGEQTLMGAGVMGAVGVKLAQPNRKVVCICGDGAFQMYNQDIPSAVQHKAPITWIILNNSSLGWPKLGQKSLGERYIATDFSVQPDFIKLAQAYSCYGEKIHHPNEIRPALEHALKANQSGESAILDFAIESDDMPEGFHIFNKLRY